MKVPIPIFQSKVMESLLKRGFTSHDANIIADTLFYAEIRGNNQGIVKLVTGAIQPGLIYEEIEVSYEKPISARINGKQRIGMVVIHEAVDVAITKAKAMGVGIVGCSNYSSATGALGHWASKIAKNNLIGIVMSQCNELMAPYGSYEPIFGTNPIAFGIPTLPRPQVFDMATSATALFGIVTAKEEGRTIPKDVAYDRNGYPTTDPTEALRGAIRVFDRSFKGSHLALMIELLAGAWTGAAMEEKEKSKNWGSLVIAMDPTILGSLEDFQSNASTMCDRVKNAKRLPGEEEREIFLPGERGDRLAEEQYKSGMIEISEHLYDRLIQSL